MEQTLTTNFGSSVPLTEPQFCSWVADALPGDRLEYHRGSLALGTFDPDGWRGMEAGRALRKLGKRALWAAEEGLVHLVQRRLAEDRYVYIAIAKSKRKAVQEKARPKAVGAG